MSFAIKPLPGRGRQFQIKSLEKALEELKKYQPPAVDDSGDGSDTATDDSGDEITVHEPAIIPATEEDLKDYIRLEGKVHGSMNIQTY